MEDIYVINKRKKFIYLYEETTQDCIAMVAINAWQYYSLFNYNIKILPELNSSLSSHHSLIWITLPVNINAHYCISPLINCCMYAVISHPIRVSNNQGNVMDKGSEADLWSACGYWLLINRQPCWSSILPILVSWCKPKRKIAFHLTYTWLHLHCYAEEQRGL